MRPYCTTITKIGAQRAQRSLFAQPSKYASHILNSMNLTTDIIFSLKDISYIKNQLAVQDRKTELAFTAIGNMNSLLNSTANHINFVEHSVTRNWAMNLELLRYSVHRTVTM